MRLLIADDDGSLRKQLRRYFEARGHQVRVARDGIEAWHLLRDEEPDCVLTDVYMPDMNGVELVRTIRRNPGTRHIPVVLFSAKPAPPANGNGRAADLELADEVLAKPLDLDLVEARLQSVVRRGVHLRPDPHHHTGGQVVVLTSAKGGAGVSSITANVALAIAESKKPGVVAVDLDLEYGDLPMLVDVPPKAGVDELIDAIDAEGDAVAPEDFVARHPTGLRVLGAPRRPVDALRVGEHGVTALLNVLRAMHDTVLVDVPPGFGDPALTALAAADRVVIVVTPEVTALRRTLTLFEVLRDLGVEEERQLLVLNETSSGSELTRERVEGFLRRRIPVAVPHALDVFRRAVTRGRPVVVDEPQHEAAQQLLRLARLLLESA